MILSKFYDLCEKQIDKILSSSFDIEDGIIEYSRTSNRNEIFFRTWTSQIIIASGNDIVVFKLFYNTDSLLKIPSLECYADSRDYLHDYCKEICNIVAGKIKLTLSAVDLNSKISLPIYSKSFDHMFTRKFSYNFYEEYLKSFTIGCEQYFYTIEFHSNNDIHISTLKEIDLTVEDLSKALEMENFIDD